MVLSPISSAYSLARQTGAQVRAGILYSGRIIQRLTAPFLLTHPLVFNIDKAVKSGMPVQHEVEQMLELVRFAGLTAKEAPLEVPIFDENTEWAKTVLGKHGMAQSLIGLHLSFKWLTGGWTAKDMATLFEQIPCIVPNSSLLVTYGPAEADAIVQVEDYYGIKLAGEKTCLVATDKGKILLAGNLPFGRWSGLLQECRMVISPDTGSLHLATALKKPVVALYEKDTFNHCSTQWAPWKVPNRIIARSDFNSTSAEILQGIRQLCAGD
jgi:ADP-heptose:LPS heptosyltransferase